MTQAASQASAFYRDVEASRKVWTMKDDRGFPIPKNSQGTRSMPFWSSESRVTRIINNIPAYKSFKPVELDLIDFYNYWLPELKSAGQLVGINWSGKRAVGYDLSPEILIRWIDQIGLKQNP